MKSIFLNRSKISYRKKSFLMILFILIVILNFLEYNLIGFIFSFLFCYMAIHAYLKNKNGIKKIEIFKDEIKMFNIKDILIFNKHINEIKIHPISSTIVCFEFDKESIYFDFGSEINDFKEMFKLELPKRNKIFSFSNFIDLIDIFR